MKTPEQKVAQRFVVLAYKRYRMNRKWRKNYISDLQGKWFKSKEEFESKLNNFYEAQNEAYNHLQLAKEIYYNL